MSIRVSANENPELANALSAQLLSDEPPKLDVPVTLPRPPSLEVELPAGLITPHEGRISNAEVRELNGEDEEALAKADAGTSLGRFIKILLQRGVTRIGNYEPPGDLLGQLVLGDRDTLLLAIRQATYGNDIEYHVTCPNCEEELDVVLDLDDDIPRKAMEDPDQRTYKIPLRNGTATVRLPTGEDQEVVLDLKGRTVPEMNTVLLSRCVNEINGSPIAHSTDAVRKLSMMDRRTILDFLNDIQPGPKYEGVKVKCASCERDVPIYIDLTMLFRS